MRGKHVRERQLFLANNPEYSSLENLAELANYSMGRVYQMLYNNEIPVYRKQLRPKGRFYYFVRLEELPEFIQHRIKYFASKEM